MNKVINRVNVDIGDYVLIDDVINQSKHRWVVLSPLTYDDEGLEIGGCVRAITQFVADADKIAAEIWDEDEEALVLEGLTPGVILEGVFVK